MTPEGQKALIFLMCLYIIFLFSFFLFPAYRALKATKKYMKEKKYIERRKTFRIVKEEE